MRSAIIVLIMLLCLGLAAADIVVQPSGTNEEVRPAAFTITGGDGITITPSTTYDILVVFLDGKMTSSYDEAAANAPLQIGTNTGAHDVMVRGIKTYTYTWESYDITKDDVPIYLEYAKYDKDDGEIKFSLAGADMIHPTLIDSTKTSSREDFQDYTVTVNEEKDLSCYPKLTTGDDLFFSCKTRGSYPKRLDIEVTLGVTMSANVEVTGIPTPMASDTTADTPETTAQNGEGAAVSRATDEEIRVANDIELMDRFKQPDAPISITVFIILLFVSFAALLFIASHHNYESKRAGTHHPLKKRK